MFIYKYVTNCYIFIVTQCYNNVKRFFKGMKFMMKGLVEIRKKKGYSQQKVALDLNISREALSYYETGKRNPDINMLLALSKYFKVSIDYLITGKEFNE